MQITNTITKMFVAVAVSVVAIGMMAAPASALSQQDLVAAGFSAEQAAIVLSLLGGSNTQAPAASCATFGLPGVSGIQQAVNALGYTPALAVDGAMGPMTRAGVRWAQALVGTSVDGVWGPMTQAAYENYVAANCAVEEEVEEEAEEPAPGQPQPGGLQGEAGFPEIASTSVDVENVVREGRLEKVLGFEVTAQDSDIQLTNLRVEMENLDVPNSNRRPDRYLDEVSVWMGDTKIASFNPANMTRNADVYSRFVSLNNAIVREGVQNRENFYIGFTAKSNIDSADFSAAFDVDVTEIRYVDGTGLLFSDGQTSLGVSGVSFEDAASAGDIRLRKILSSNTPGEQSVEINEFSNTSNLQVLEFQLRAESTDMEVNQIWIDMDAQNLGAGNDISDLVVTSRLRHNNSTLASLTGAQILSDLGVAKFELPSQFEISEGNTETFSVEVTVRRQQDNLSPSQDNFANGATLRASLNTVAAEDIDGNAITNFVGSASGFTQMFYVNGAEIAYVSSSSSSTNNDNTSRDYVLVFDVTAVGENIEVDRTSFSPTGVQFLLSENGFENEFGDDGITASLGSNASLSSNVYTVNAGETRRFTLTVNASSTGGDVSSGLKRLSLVAVAGFEPIATVEGTSVTLN